MCSIRALGIGQAAPVSEVYVSAETSGCSTSDWENPAARAVPRQATSTSLRIIAGAVASSAERSSSGEGTLIA